MKKKWELLFSIMEKASENESFRERMLSDAKSAISDEFDISLPDAVNLVVHENDGKTFHMSLPPKPQVLDEGKLAQFAGGSCSCVPCDCG